VKIGKVKVETRVRELNNYLYDGLSEMKKAPDNSDTRRRRVAYLHGDFKTA
jgi:hypothetical protein